MTSGERSWAWQLVEGVLLIVLGVGMVIQTSYFQDQNAVQRRCISDNFRELTVTLIARAELATREADASKRVWLVWADAAGLLRNDPTRPLPPKERARLQRELVDALLNFREVTDDVARERRDRPVPPYPEGECE